MDSENITFTYTIKKFGSKYHLIEDNTNITIHIYNNFNDAFEEGLKLNEEKMKQDFKNKISTYINI